MDGQNDSIVLEEEIDPNYEPTEREVLEYATWLGMDLDNEQDLFWIAREGLKAPLPENWKPCKTTDTEEIYYFNFATGQSTWDHPCDEDTDEKKKKEKEDVAELLGRKSSGKKKKGSLTKAEPLLGPPSLGKSHPLEKKPLPGLSSKLGGLGAIGGPTVGGLRSVGSLGRLKGESKDLDDSSKDDRDGSDDDPPVISAAGFSKPPLGGLLTKKALPTASSTTSSLSLSRADSKAEMDALTADFEQKKQKLLDDHAKVLRDLEEQHRDAMDTLQKKMQKQLDELQDDEESRLKQKKRELEKQRSDLENRFDTEERNLLRERKEKIKEMENDLETAVAEKRQEMDKEIQKETDRLQSKHETRLRDLKDEHEREEKQVQAKLRAVLGEKAQGVDVASELKDEVDRLKQALSSLEKECQNSRDENDALMQGKIDVEEQFEQAQREIDALQRQLRGASDTETKALPESCSECDAYQVQVRTMEQERDQMRAEVEQLKSTVQTQEEAISALHERIEVERNASSDSKDGGEEVAADVAARELQEKDIEIAQLREQETNLSAEMAALRAKEESVRKELASMSERCAQLSAEKSQLVDQLEARKSRAEIVPETSVAAASHREKGAQVECDLLASRVEASNLKNELSELQEQLAVLSKTNTQIKEQLLKESNEKKSLREQLDAKAEHSSQELSKTMAQLRQRIEELETQLDSERSSRDELEQSREQLRREKQELELEKRKSESDFSRLDSEKRHLESEKALLSRQLKELSDFLKQQEQSSALVGNAELTKQEWEIEQLHANLKMVETDKEDLGVRLKQLESELESLGTAKHRLELERESEQSRSKKAECERAALAQRLKNLEDDYGACERKLRVMNAENAELKAQLHKTKFKEQSTTDKVAQLTDEIAQLEQTVQSQQAELEKASKENRAKIHQIEQKVMESSELRAEKEMLQDQVSDLKASLADVKARHQQQQQQLASGNQSSSTLQNAEMQQAKRDLAEYEAKVESLVYEKAQLVEKARAGAHKAMELENTLRGGELERDRLGDELQAASTELARWKDKVEKNKKELEQMTMSMRNLEADKELVDAALAKEKLEKNDILTLKLGIEKSKRTLESELESLAMQVQGMETAQRSSGFEAQSLQSKLKRLESEHSNLTKELKALQEDKQELESKLRQQSQENSSLESRIRVLRSENSEQDVQAKHYEDDLSRTSEVVKKLEAQLAETQLKWKRECDEKEILSKQMSVLNAAREELEGTLASMKRKLDAAESKWRDQESSLTRDDFQLKLKLQQAEADREGLLHSRERVEIQLKTAEKELTAMKDELAIARGDSESLRARIKTLASEKEEIQATLLSSNLANASGASSSRISGLAHETSSEAMLVKLQLADVNKSELESHLADVASQLEISNRRCAALEARCRDQAVDMESLHVEVSSLRAATQKMHLSALETLSLTERLEYEHKKRALKSDFLSQLRDFQDREDRALIRHKARLRAQYEKQLDDLLAELEKKKQIRMEQEGALTLQMMEQIRQEREMKRKELKRQVREELQDLERDLVERKDHHLQTIAEVIRKEEEGLGARLRESRQFLREEELVRAAAHATASASPTQKQQKSSTSPRSPGEVPTNHHRRLPFEVEDDEGDDARERHGDNNAETRDELRIDGFATLSPRRKSVHTNNRKPTRSGRVEENQSYRHLQRRRGRSANAKEHRRWSQRLRDENDLLAKAKALVRNQRRELKTQADQIKRDKQEWKRDHHTTKHQKHNAILQEMKHMIEQNTATWNQSVKRLREREAWIKKREHKIAKMQRIVDKLRSARSSSAGNLRRSNNNNNNSGGYISDDEDEDDEGFLSEEDGESNPSEIDSLLDTLEKLDEELVSEVGELSEDLSGETRQRSRPFSKLASPIDRYRGWEGGDDREYDLGPEVANLRGHWPVSYMSAPVTPSDFPVAPMWRYPLHSALQGYPSLSRTMGGGMDGYHHPPSASLGGSTDLYSPGITTTSRLFSSSARPYPQRMSGLSQTTRPKTSKGSNDYVPERVEMFQRQISRWAKDREKVQHAATKHASWLTGMCQELKEYGAKYKHDDGAAVRDSEAAITLLDEGNDLL